MKAIIEIDLDGAAFDGDTGAELVWTIQELFRNRLDDIAETAEHGGRVKIMDRNGNACGSFKVTR